MSAVCNHHVGFIPPAEVTSGDWNKKLAEFVVKVEMKKLRNEVGNHDQPGLIRENNCCSKCGATLDWVALGLLDYEEASAIYMTTLPHPQQPATGCKYQDGNDGDD